MRSVLLPTGEPIPILGQGTWRLGESRLHGEAECEALRLGMDLGMTLIDTAEMYGEGSTEELVGRAVQGRRDEAFLVSKVYPHNASRSGMAEACERSLRRLRTDRLDLYLLHWRGSIPLAETVEGFERLCRNGKIRHWGVSNFDRSDMEELWALEVGRHVVVNQVLYNLQERGIEWDLLPWCRERGIRIMAYTPLGEGAALPRHPALREGARRRGVTAAQLALAWVLRAPGVMAIPKAGQPEHVRENAAAADLALSQAELAELNRAFPPPQGPAALAIL